MPQNSGNYGSSTVIRDNVSANLVRSEAAATAAEASAVAALASEGLADADATTTTANAAATAADVLLTNADVASTSSDVSITNADVVITTADVVSTNANAAQTALDVIATAADVVTIAGSEAATSADAISTAADVVSTNADVVSTNADAAATAIDAASTTADAVQTALDVIATAADVVTTNADVVLTAADVVSADASAVSAAASAAAALPATSSVSRNQVLNQNPLSQGLSQRVGFSSTLGTAAHGLPSANFLRATKDRNNATGWVWSDSVRGDNYLASNSTAAEVATIPAVNSDDVSFGWDLPDSFTGTTNRNKAYTAHYNAEMGVSVVGYEGDGVDGHEIPHHLGRDSELSVFKDRDTVSGWRVVSPLFSDEYLTLQGTAALTASVGIAKFSDTGIALSDSATTNGSTKNIIAYNFASIEGVSKVGKYRGTAAAGNYVDCGFGDKFAGFVLVKNLSTASDWRLLDSSRGEADFLEPNTSDAEGTWTSQFDFVTGGFVLKGSASQSNALNDEYLFLAFADNTGSTGETDYDYPTTDDVLTIEQDTLISFADGFSSSGETNVQENVPAATTMTFGAGFEDAKYYIYKEEGGAYGATLYRLLEDQDYSGVQTPNQTDPNLRTTAKHFDYESSTGVVLASGEVATEEAYNALNKSTLSTSKWSILSTTISTFQIKGVEKRVLKSWRMRASDDADTIPRLFDIEGSNDGFTWTVIDSTYNASDFPDPTVGLWSALQSTSGNTTAYLYHRVNITANHGDGAATEICELEFNTEAPSDRYDVSEGVMYSYAGTAINRVYLGELTTDADGDIINNTIVNYTPNKLKNTDAEFHGDLIVHGEVVNKGAATATASVDGSQNPPLIRDSLNIVDIVDMGTGKYEAAFETPMDHKWYTVSILAKGADSNANSASQRLFPLKFNQTVNGFEFWLTNASAATLYDAELIDIHVFGGKA